VTVLESPWKAGNKLVHIGIKGYETTGAEMPRSNLVFLLDVSGSMNAPDKLPLVKQSLSLLLSQLQPDDTVAIAVYAGAAGTILPPTPASQKQTILDAMQRLSAGGSTAGGAGIKLAYQLAQSAFVKDGVNRVILATDGDFNVGITNSDELQDFVERQRSSGIFLSILGFGEGNYQDARMQALAQNGNGVAAYIDTLAEAQKVLVQEATSTLFTIAKDVKFQVEFNPAVVSEYRLIGYETRGLNREDFKNDAVDAGDIGAGHTVTAIYEIVPVGSDNALIPESRYETNLSKGEGDLEYGFLKIRYKQPDSDTSALIEVPILQGQEATPLQLNEALFGVSVAGFSQLLRGGTYTGDWALDDALTLALANRGEDTYGYRSEFTQLVRKAISAENMR
jgi:Ca-activated chloride channel family protein